MWSATDEDSSDLLSVPLLVQRFREGLGVGRDRPVTWADVELIGQRLALLPDHAEPDGITRQLWLLAAAWMRHVYPGEPSRTYVEFGQLICELALRGRERLGPHSGRQARAHAEVLRILDQPDLRQHAPASSKAFLAVHTLVQVLCARDFRLGDVIDEHN